MKLHPSIQALAEEIETFRSRNGLSATKFGKAALNDEKFVHDLRRGRIPSLVTIDRVREFMRSQQESAA